MSDKPKWTPGPWSVNWARSGAEIFAHDGKWLMTMERPLSQIHANAHLIAAAPELYEALRLYVENDDIGARIGTPAFKAAAAALAKARGEEA